MTKKLPLSEVTQPLVDGVVDIDDLVLLRKSVEKWAETASKAVSTFKRKEDGSFWRDSKSAGDSKKEPHITTSARSYIALLYADRLRDTKKDEGPPEWLGEFANFMARATVGRSGRQFYEAIKVRQEGVKIDPYEFNTFDIAHLADFFQVSDYLNRFYKDAYEKKRTFQGQEPEKNTGLSSFFVSEEKEFLPIKSVKSDSDAGEVDPYVGCDSRAAIRMRLRKVIKDAANRVKDGLGFPGEVEFEEHRPDSRHYFATLHTLRALHVLDVPNTKDEEMEGWIQEIVAGARSFAIEQSYYSQRGVAHRQDPVRLAFAGCIYAIYGEHVDQDLCLSIVEALAAGQQRSGNWPATHPVFRENRGPWHIASHEVALCLSWLYFQPRVPDSARPLILGMMRRYFLNAVIPTYIRAAGKTTSSEKKLHGWQDDHTVSPDTTVGWATAIVCHFLAGFTQVLNDWINRRVIEELGLQFTTEDYLIDDAASSPSMRWARDTDRPVVWPDLPPHGWSKDQPESGDLKEKIENRWTDPSKKAAISDNIAKKVLVGIYNNPSERPRRDGCAGLMPGSPGTRKTSLVNRISKILCWPKVAVPAASIFEDGFDRMEARANRVFGLLNHLRGCVIFFDEFEEFFLSRGEDNSTAPAAEGNAGSGSEAYKSRTIAAFTTSAMLPRLQDLHDQNRCLIFLATNWPDKLDSAIIRAGRFDFTITVEHPTIERLSEYLADKCDNIRKKCENMSTATNGEDNKEATLLKQELTALSAVRDVISERAKTNSAEIVRFAIAEEMLRQVRSLAEDDLLKGKAKAKETLREQLEASMGDKKPPELTNP